MLLLVSILVAAAAMCVWSHIDNTYLWATTPYPLPPDAPRLVPFVVPTPRGDLRFRVLDSEEAEFTVAILSSRHYTQLVPLAMSCMDGEGKPLRVVLIEPPSNSAHAAEYAKYVREEDIDVVVMDLFAPLYPHSDLFIDPETTLERIASLHPLLSILYEFYNVINETVPFNEAKYSYTQRRLLMPSVGHRYELLRPDFVVVLCIGGGISCPVAV